MKWDSERPCQQDDIVKKNKLTSQKSIVWEAPVGGTKQPREKVYSQKIHFTFQELLSLLELIYWTKSENNGDNYIPVHNKTPNPEHWRHLIVPSLFLPLSTLTFVESLDGSSHRFSPRRKTLGWDASVSWSTSPTTFCWTSEISVTEATAAPFSTS